MADRVSNVRKKELEQPDPFLESMYKTITNVKKFRKQLLWSGGIITAIICIISVTIYTIHSAETTASTVLADAIKSYGTQQPVQGYDAVKDQFMTLLNEYSNTSSGKLGRVKFAQICYAAKKYDLAYKHYISALDDFKDDPAMNNIVLSSIAHTCQALKKYQEAEQYFKKIINGTTALMKEDALFNLGMVAITNGDKQRGIDSLKKISSGYQNSMYKVMADEIIARN